MSKDLKIMGSRRKGDLTISDKILYTAKGEEKMVLLENISSVEIGRFLDNFNTEWVKIVHTDREGNEVAELFADGKILGWRGILGGTGKLLKAIETARNSI